MLAGEECGHAGCAAGLPQTQRVQRGQSQTQRSALSAHCWRNEAIGINSMRCLTERLLNRCTVTFIVVCSCCATPLWPARMSAAKCWLWCRCARRTARASGSRAARARRTTPHSVDDRLHRAPHCQRRPRTLAVAAAEEGTGQRQHSTTVARVSRQSTDTRCAVRRCVF